MVMNPYSAGPLITHLNGRFTHPLTPLTYEYVGMDMRTGWKSYILHSKEIIEWIENMSTSDWNTLAVEKEYGMMLIAYSMSPQLETMFILRWA